MEQEKIELVFPSEEYKSKVIEYLKEHIDNNEPNLNGDAGLDGIKDFDLWLEKVRKDLNRKDEEKISATEYLIVRKNDDKVVGMLQIRHKLNKYLLEYAGHIGYGIRPSERRKGYAKQGLKLALEKCKELNMDKVLITCDKSNVGSRKTIISNGGILENEVEQEDGEILQRYWIEI